MNNFARASKPQRLAPLGCFAMGIGWLRLGRMNPAAEPLQVLAIANGSDWSPQPLTLHRPLADGSFESHPSWFSDDYDHHMGLAVGDLSGNGYQDVVVAVFCDKAQDLSKGGVKVYRGGPEGLAQSPEWLCRGFAATGVFLADLSGNGKLDILVACPWETGSIQKPGPGGQGELDGRARMLINRSQCESGSLAFEERVIDHPLATGCGDISAADVDFDGNPDIVLASGKTSVLFGPFDLCRPDAFSSAASWSSAEEHPYSFTARAFPHPEFPEGQLLVSSRGLASAAQLKGRSLAELDSGIFVHMPVRGVAETSAIQHLACFNAQQPALPAGLSILHSESGLPEIVAGFLDLRTTQMTGVPLRVFHGAPDRKSPFENPEGSPLSGGGLMAGHVSVQNQFGSSQSRYSRHTIEKENGRYLSLPQLPAGTVVSLEVYEANSSEDTASSFTFTVASDGSAVSIHPPLPRGSEVIIQEELGESNFIAATSSAAWPPAGATRVWTIEAEREELGTPKSGVMRVARALRRSA